MIKKCIICKKEFESEIDIEDICRPCILKENINSSRNKGGCIYISKNYEKQLLEKLSELEHNQWWEWSRTLAERMEKWTKDDCIITVEESIENQINQWEKNWNFYKFLDQKNKEFDRVYAKKIIELLKKEGVLKLI